MKTKFQIDTDTLLNQIIPFLVSDFVTHSNEIHARQEMEWNEFFIFLGASQKAAIEKAEKFGWNVIKWNKKTQNVTLESGKREMTIDKNGKRI